MLIQDKQTNGAIYAPADVLNTATAIDNVVSLRNRDELNRFRILYDRTHLISLTGSDGQQSSGFIKLNVPMRFSGTTSSIANATSNSFSVMDMAEIASAQFTLHYRVFYTDD